MKPSLILAGLAGLLAAAPAWAENSPEGDACAKARDPVRCETRDAALKTCADLRGVDKRLCFEEQMLPVECGTAQDPARCEHVRLAKAACGDQLGEEHRRCLRAQGAPAEPARKKAKSTKKKRAKPHSTAKTKHKSPTPLSPPATVR